MNYFHGRWLILSSALCLGLLSASCEKKAGSSGVLTGQFREVDDFAFTTQDEGTLSRDDLKGKVWVANFIFTSCAAECLVLSNRIAELQLAFRDNEDVKFVSFSVDPQTDTPERLKNFASRWHADPEAWNFVTGEPASVDNIVKKSFLLPVTRDPIEAGKLLSQNFVHSNRFAIVDRKGVVRAYVDGLPQESVSTISRIVVQLLQEPASGLSENSNPSENPPSS